MEQRSRMMSVTEARARIRAEIRPLPAEHVPLGAALGRILSESVESAIPLPPFDNSAMDGFAVRSSATMRATPFQPVMLTIAGDIRAGSDSRGCVGPGETRRIMTGAPLPQGTDAVIRLEEVRERDGLLEIPRPVPAGENVRFAGEDLPRGARVLEAGTLLTPARIALLAGIGRSHVPLFGIPHVAIVTTGDELAEPGEALRFGQIYDSNAPAIEAMVREAGGIPVRFKAVRDDAEQTRQVLRRALACDLVVTSGGVSMGAYDFVGQSLAELGKVLFTAVAQQPGKPFTFAILQGKPTFGLPGNPAAAMVSFEVYVRPSLLAMQGHLQPERPRLRVTVTEPLEGRPGRQQFLRAVVRADSNGYAASLAGAQGSGMLGSMAAANALLVVPAESPGVAAGDVIEAMVLDPAAAMTGYFPNNT